MTAPWDHLPPVDHPLSAAPHQESGLPTSLPVIIIGAGLAGCWLAHLLAERGVKVTVLDRHNQPAGGASGNPAGIVKPFVTRQPGTAMSFHVLAHQFLVERLQRYKLAQRAEFHASGVLQLVENAYPGASEFQNVNAVTTTQLAGTDIHSKALYFTDSGWLNPSALCKALIDNPNIALKRNTTVLSIDPAQSAADQHHLDRNVERRTWEITLHDNSRMLTEHLVIATGEAFDLIPTGKYLPLTPARGQISEFQLAHNVKTPACVVSGKHYVIPFGKSVLVGATFQRNVTDASVNQTDHEENLAGLSNLMPSLKVNPQASAGYAGVRATTPDRLPVVGPMPDLAECEAVYADIRHGKALSRFPALPTIKGLYLLSGLGSRGIVTSAMSAHLLADYLMGLDQPASALISILPPSAPSAFARYNPQTSDAMTKGSLADWTPVLNPVRFLIRDLKRGMTRHG